EADYEENYAFDDTEAEFLELLKPTYEDLLHEIKSVITNNDQILQFLEALFTQYRGIEEDLKYFEPLLKTLVQNEKLAIETKEMMAQYEIEEKILPQLVLDIHELTGNRESWLDHAKSYYKEDKELAQKLMAFYL